MKTLIGWSRRLVSIGLVGLAGLAAPGGARAAHAAPAARTKTADVDISPQVAALATNNIAAAVTAATQLGAMTSPKAHEALLDVLAVGPHPAVAVAAIGAIAARPSPADVAMLVRYSRYRGAEVRVAVMKALAVYSDPKSKQALVGGLSDQLPGVRQAASQAIGQARVREAIPALTTLLARGDVPAALALGQLADIEIARNIAEQVGQIPDAALATCLGAILRRPDFGPDPARVQVVTAIGKIISNDAIIALNDYISATPANPPRPSLVAAQAIVDARIGGR